MEIDQNYALWKIVRSPFLFPSTYGGHKCEWECFAWAKAGCLLCSQQHSCPSEECNIETADDGHSTCVITGSVLSMTSFQNEWAAHERTAASPNQFKRKNYKKIASCYYEEPECVKDYVYLTIKELLLSNTATQCRNRELERLFNAQLHFLHKAIKNETKTPNLLRIAAYVAYNTRKIRRPLQLSDDELEHILQFCTEAICKILLIHNQVNLCKTLNNETRKREFICSMLYLTRMGVEYHGETILPKIPVMKFILPLETCLPEMFSIRSKSITEGDSCQ